MAKKVIPDYIKVGEGFADITLSRPASFAGAKLAVVRMREPLVRDQKAVMKSAGDESDKETLLFANLIDQAPSDIDEMPLKDYLRLQAGYNTFTS